VLGGVTGVVALLVGGTVDGVFVVVVVVEADDVNTGGWVGGPVSSTVVVVVVPSGRVTVVIFVFFGGVVVVVVSDDVSGVVRVTGAVVVRTGVLLRVLLDTTSSRGADLAGAASSGCPLANVATAANSVATTMPAEARITCGPIRKRLRSSGSGVSYSPSVTPSPEIV
jgi:hypothetical protein